MILKALDSISAPTAAQLDLAYADGVRAWNGYLYWPKYWFKASFDLVKAHGMQCLGYATGWGDPTAAKALAASWDVRGCLDVESGTRPYGAWTQPWLDASGFGVYASESGYPNVTAAFHIVACYRPSSDPRADWPAGMARPATPLGWQWAGTVAKYGTSVDLSWFDDAIFGIGTMDDMSVLSEQQIADLHAAVFGPVPINGGEGTAPGNNLDIIRRRVSGYDQGYPAASGAELNVLASAPSSLTAAQVAAIAQIPAIAAAIAAGAVTEAHIESALKAA